MESKGLARNIIKVGISNLFTILSGIIVGFVIPKIMGLEDYGYYKTFTLYVSYVGLFHLGFIDGIYLKYGGVSYDDFDKSRFRMYSRFIIFFESPILDGEYSKIMGSIFKNPGNYTKIIDTLCKKKSGMTRKEITDETGLSGGYLSELLDNLEGCDFIRGFNSRNKVKEKIWQVIDPLYFSIISFYITKKL